MRAAFQEGLLLPTLGRARVFWKALTCSEPAGMEAPGDAVAGGCSQGSLWLPVLPEDFPCWMERCWLVLGSAAGTDGC